MEEKTEDLETLVRKNEAKIEFESTRTTYNNRRIASLARWIKIHSVIIMVLCIVVMLLAMKLRT